MFVLVYYEYVIQYTYESIGFKQIQTYIKLSLYYKNLLADKEFLSTEVVVVDDDVETSPNTEFMFEEFWTEWFVDDVTAKLLAFKTLELLVVLTTSYEC